MQETANFFRNKSNLFTSVGLLILILALPVGLNLVKRVQTFFSRASTEESISLADEGSCLYDKQTNKIHCGTVSLKLTSPYGMRVEGSPSPLASISPSPVISPSPASSAHSCVGANQFSANLTGALEVPSNQSNATSQAVIGVIEQSDSSQIVVGIDSANLNLGQVSAIHIHAPASPGQNGPIVYTVYTQDSAAFSDPFIKFDDLPLSVLEQLRSKQAYINIHTTNFPDGEIRGFLDCVDLFSDSQSVSPQLGEILNNPAGFSNPTTSAENSSNPCSDSIDNDSDGAADQADSGCHEDANPKNDQSYNPNINSEGPLHDAQNCFDSKDNDNDGEIDGGDADCHTDNNPLNRTSFDSSGTTEQHGSIYTLNYKLAESEAGLASAQAFPYTDQPLITNFTLQNSAVGVKQIWVEFSDNNGRHSRDHISVELIDPPAQLSGIDCTLDIGKSNLKVTLKGYSLGTKIGKVTANGEELDILEWKGDQVIGILKKPDISIDDGQKFVIKFIRSDNLTLDDQVCRVNTSIISLGAQVFCREPGMFDQSNVKVTIVDQNKTRVEENASITKDGTLQGLKTKLQSGKRYALSIKAPNAIRRTAVFTAQEGTTIVTTPEGNPLILPIGDLSPRNLPDGKINSPDRAELIRQWRLLGSVSNTITADFNRDSKVNSIDWACMRYDFNAEDNAIPEIVPDPIRTNPPIDIPLKSPAASASAALSPAQFVLTADKLSANIGEEILIKIWTRTDQDSANLFASLLHFSSDKLEVISVEKDGSFVTSWTEEFYDNSTGEISLVGGVPNPGFKTTGTNAWLATIKMKAKASGSATVSFVNGSQIFRNSDNLDILLFSPQALQVSIP